MTLTLSKVMREQAPDDGLSVSSAADAGENAVNKVVAEQSATAAEVGSAMKVFEGDLSS